MSDGSLNLTTGRHFRQNLQTHSHPLTVQSEVLYKIVNGQVVPADVNMWMMQSTLY